MPTIKYFRRQIYGNQTWYPTEEKYAVAIMLLSGKRTITGKIKLGLEALGFDLEEVLEPKVKPSYSIL
jgi:hypothetical protein